MSFVLINSAYTSTSPMAAHIVGCGINSYNPKYLMYIVKKFLQIFSVLLLSFISVVVIGMVNPQIARAEECSWDVGRAAGGSELECDEQKHRLQVNNTSAFGYFYVSEDGTSIVIATGDVEGKRYKGCTGSNINNCTSTENPIDTRINDTAFFIQPNTTGLCGPQNKLGDSCDNAWATGRGGGITIDQAQANKLASAKASFKVDGGGICEASGVALDFIFCPIYNGTTAAIAGLIGGTGQDGDRPGLLVSFLTVNINDSNANNNPLQTIVGSIIVLANAIYVLIFILLIFSASLPLGLDNYSIKKMLPKFVGAVIMTQFAYPITVGVVEFFNLLGTVVPNVIFGFIPIVERSGAPATNLSGTGGIAIGLGTALVFTQAPSILSTIFIIFILLAIVALIAVIISFVFLTIRLIIIYILILLAPLAFASWVLPGTEKFFTNWWKNFIRLNAMFPMITGLLAVSILLSKIFLSIGGG